MMTLRDFASLSEDSKTDVVELWGELLTEKVVPGYRVKVYRLYSFYVEVYHSTKDNRIARHRVCARRETVFG
jgi:hypothetical protein